MPLAKKKSFASHLLGRWYWAVAILLAVGVWLGLALGLRPLKDGDGTYASSPYGLNTGLENNAALVQGAIKTAGQVEPYLNRYQFDLVYSF